MKHIIFIKVFYKYSNFSNNYIAEIQYKYPYSLLIAANYKASDYRLLPRAIGQIICLKRAHRYRGSFLEISKEMDNFFAYLSSTGTCSPLVLFLVNKHTRKFTFAHMPI